jgi:hypothetical protein
VSLSAPDLQDALDECVSDTLALPLVFDREVIQKHMAITVRAE